MIDLPGHEQAEDLGDVELPPGWGLFRLPNNHPICLDVESIHMVAPDVNGNTDGPTILYRMLEPDQLEVSDSLAEVMYIITRAKETVVAEYEEVEQDAE